MKINSTKKKITTLGVVEESYIQKKDLDEVLRLVTKRTVYSQIEISEFLKKPTLVILFRYITHLKKLIDYETLLESNILSGPLQGIKELKHEDYLYIKKEGGINTRFTFDYTQVCRGDLEGYQEI